MNRYWDLTEQERAALGYEDLDTYKNYQLMEEGVVVPVKPKIVEVTVPTLDKTVSATKIGTSTYSTFFATTDDTLMAAISKAAADGKLFSINNKYCNNVTSEYLERIEEPMATSCTFFDKQRLEEHIATTSDVQARDKMNKELMSEYNKAVESASDAMESIVTDWREQCETRDSNQSIVDTFENFIETSGGDKEVAYKFMLKRWDAEEIDAAFKWLGVKLDVERQLNEKDGE